MGRLVFDYRVHHLKSGWAEVELLQESSSFGSRHHIIRWLNIAPPLVGSYPRFPYSSPLASRPTSSPKATGPSGPSPPSPFSRLHPRTRTPNPHPHR
jgi:hypothetical protein